MDKHNNPKQSPRVSVLIPVYNGEHYLKFALDSVHAQTFSDYELIVMDDGSTDQTAAIAQSDSSVHLIRGEHRGISVSRNLAIDAAKGEFIAFLDADDMWAPEKLEKQVAYLDNNPDSGMIFTDLKNFFDGEPEEMTDRQKQLMNAKPDRYLVTGCIRAELFRKYGNFREDLRYGEDTEWIMRLCAAGIRVNEMIHEELYLRRIHNNNISLSHKTVEQNTMLTLLAQAIRRARKGGLTEQ